MSCLLISAPCSNSFSQTVTLPSLAAYISGDMRYLVGKKNVATLVGKMSEIVIDRVKLESTKRAFFTKGQIFLIIVYEF